MEEPNHPQYDERFLKEPSKIGDVLEFLDIMANANKMEDPKLKGKKAEAKPVVDISAGVTDTNYFITSRSPTGRFSVKRSKGKIRMSSNTNQFTFMRQIDQTDEERAKTRIEREKIANNFRRWGNAVYRKEQYQLAIDLYTKGLEYINDTSVLYLNRACCHLKLRNFKRALMDCDYIITKLDPKNIRAYLYRAAAYKRLNQEKNYEDTVYQVKRENIFDVEFIEEFLENIKTM